jgi:hypothetical protein
MAIVLRRVLPARLLARLDLRSLRAVRTVHTNARLRNREPDLCFRVNAMHAGQRIAIYLVVEHRSTCEPRMPWRALLYAGEEWDRYVREHPRRRRRLPFILPLVLTQHPARNTPTQLSAILDVPPGLRQVLGAPFEVVLHVDDFSGSVLGDRKAPPAVRALVELARALLHAYGNPRSLTRDRLARLAPLVDVLLRHERPDDVEALWVYVISVFDIGSPLRRAFIEALSTPAREMYMTIEEHLLARGQKIGQKIGEAKGQAKALLQVLEQRGVPVSASVRRRVLATRDERRLRRWLDEALSIASAEELFAAAPRRRGARAGVAA